VQHVQNLKAQGAKWVTSDRSEAAANDGFTGRAARTLRNNIESAAMYVPIAAAAAILHLNSTVITWVAVVYIIVRTTFTLFYWFGINQLRSLSWLIGMICILVLAINVAVSLAAI
jgi:glutathione S-transferase